MSEGSAANEDGKLRTESFRIKNQKANELFVGGEKHAIMVKGWRETA